MKELLPYVGLIAIVISLVQVAYARKRDTQEDWKEKFKELAKDLKDLADDLKGAVHRLTVIETKSEIYFRGMSVSKAQRLISPHTPELDDLLRKFQREEIVNEKELHRLKELLRDIADNDPDQSRRDLATDTLLLIHVRFEVGGDLMEKLHEQNQGVTDSIYNFSARIKP